MKTFHVSMKKTLNEKGKSIWTAFGSNHFDRAALISKR